MSRKNKVEAVARSVAESVRWRFMTRDKRAERIKQIVKAKIAKLRGEASA
jgi:predicted Fe-S protein YdhL (DUF1289 family)